MAMWSGPPRRPARAFTDAGIRKSGGCTTTRSCTSLQIPGVLTARLDRARGETEGLISIDETLCKKLKNRSDRHAVQFTGDLSHCSECREYSECSECSSESGRRLHDCASLAWGHRLHAVLRAVP